MDLSKGYERKLERAVREFGERKGEQAKEEDGVNAVIGSAKLFPSFKKVEPITQTKATKPHPPSLLQIHNLTLPTERHARTHGRRLSFWHFCEKL